MVSGKPFHPDWCNVTRAPYGRWPAPVCFLFGRFHGTSADETESWLDVQLGCTETGSTTSACVLVPFHGLAARSTPPSPPPPPPPCGTGLDRNFDSSVYESVTPRKRHRLVERLWRMTDDPRPREVPLWRPGPGAAGIGSFTGLVVRPLSLRRTSMINFGKNNNNNMVKFRVSCS